MSSIFLATNAVLHLYSDPDLSQISPCTLPHGAVALLDPRAQPSDSESARSSRLRPCLTLPYNKVRGCATNVGPACAGALMDPSTFVSRPLLFYCIKSGGGNTLFGPAMSGAAHRMRRWLVCCGPRMFVTSLLTPVFEFDRCYEGPRTSTVVS